MELLDRDSHYLVDDTNADIEVNYLRDEFIHSEVKDSTEFSTKCDNIMNSFFGTLPTFKQDYMDMFEELKSSESGKLLKKIAHEQGIGNYHIPIFDNWLECLIEKYIYSKELTFDDGSKIIFRKVRIDPPSYNKGTEKYSLMPKMAREQGVTYGVDIYLDMIKVDEEGESFGESYTKKNVFIGNIPIPLKSRHCYLRGKSQIDLARLGEDPNDSGGYFIVEGGEKVVLGQEQLITDKILLMNTNGYVSCKLTANTGGGTVVMEISENDSNNNVIEILIPGMKPARSTEPKSLNVLRIFRLFAQFEQKRLDELGEEPNELSQLDQADNIKRYIERFITDGTDVRKKIMLKLNRTLMDFNLLADDRQIISKNMDKKDEGITDDEIRQLFHTNIYPHLNNLIPMDGESVVNHQIRIIFAKIDLLTIMLIRLLKHSAGYGDLDNRDSWSNKRVETAGRLMETLFRLSWKKTLEIAQGHIKNTPRKDDLDKFQFITTGINQSTIVTCTFRDSFISGKWGMKGTNLKDAVAQPLNRDGMVATFAHLNAVDVAISRTDIHYILRLVQMDQFGFISAFFTPEGKGCGLLKNVCITTRLSVGRDDTNIIRHLLGDGDRLKRLVALTYQESIERNLKDKIIVAAKFIGWGDGEAIRQDLISKRRSGEFYHDMSVIKEDDYVYVDVSPSRPIRPLLLVNPKSQNSEYSKDEPFLMIDLKDKRNSSNHELVVEGCMEYLSPWEQEYIKLAMSVDRNTERWGSINKAKQALEQEKQLYNDVISSKDKIAISKEGREVDFKEAENRVEQALEIYNKAVSTRSFTHCEIDPLDLCDIAASLIPWPDHNQAPRNTYQVSMGKQALGTYHSNHINRMNDGNTKILAFPQRPLVGTDMYGVIGLDLNGPGENVNQQFLAVPYTEEDSFVMKRQFFDNAGLRMYKYITYKTIINNSNEHWDEQLGKPTLTDKDKEHLHKYRYMSDNGLPMIGAPLKEGDYIIGKILTPKKDKTQPPKSDSVVVRIGDSGVVEKISISSNNLKTIVIVKMRVMRVPQEGDKYAPRNAQKGTIGLVVSDVDLQYGLRGTTADVTANPMSMPSRMTCAYPQEIHSSKAAAMIGTHINAGAHNRYDRDKYRNDLKRYGLHEFAYEEMRSGTTGNYLEDLVSSGPVFFQSLKHHVPDKIQARGIGQVNPQTRQPLRGRTNRGGLRFGEMERDVAIAYGASAFLRERLMSVSDEYQTVFCIVCGNFAINDQYTNFYKTCPLCGNEDKFGRCSIPYVYKLLMHLLAAPGLNLRPELMTNADYALKVLPKEKRVTTKLLEEEYDEALIDENEDAEETEDAEIQMEEQAEDEGVIDEYDEGGDYDGNDY